MSDDVIDIDALAAKIAAEARGAGGPGDDELAATLMAGDAAVLDAPTQVPALWGPGTPSCGPRARR